MTNETLKTEANNLVERGKELVAQGNQRRLVFRNKDGKALVQSSLTVAAAIAFVMLVTGFISIPMIVIASIIAMVWGIRVEVQNTSTTVEIEA